VLGVLPEQPVHDVGRHGLVGDDHWLTSRAEPV
jgi:hypothetical protein